LLGNSPSTRELDRIYAQPTHITWQINEAKHFVISVDFDSMM